MRRGLRALALLALSVAASGAGGKSFLTLVSTTTTRDSGLLDHLLPVFERQTGVTVRVISVGTGQALEIGRRGDADALLVHDRQSEDAFVAEGFALSRRDVMYNDFVIVGPAADPAGVRGLAKASEAFGRIAAAKAGFVSRGDDSGTHKNELRRWQEAGLDPRAASGSWYRETGSGMGPTLVTADELGAYTLTDRGTWLAYRRRGGLALLFEGGAELRNPYGVLVVNPARHPHVNVALATRFADWITSPAGQKAIESFQIDRETVFHPNAR